MLFPSRLITKAVEVESRICKELASSRKATVTRPVLLELFFINSGENYFFQHLVKAFEIQHRNQARVRLDLYVNSPV